MVAASETVDGPGHGLQRSLRLWKVTIGNKLSKLDPKFPGLSVFAYLITMLM